MYDSTYAIYHRYWIAGTWNIYRVTRIFIAEVVLTQVDTLLNLLQSPTKTLELLTQRTKSLAIISEMASDICASVPYILGHNQPYHDQFINPPPAACGFFLLLPLYLAGSTVGVPHTMRMYVLGRLRYIGHRLGIQQSLLLEEILGGRIQACKVGGTDEMEGLPRQFRPKLGDEAGDGARIDGDAYAEDMGRNGVADVMTGYGMAQSTADGWNGGGLTH